MCIMGNFEPRWCLSHAIGRQSLNGLKCWALSYVSHTVQKQFVCSVAQRNRQNVWLESLGGSTIGYIFLYDTNEFARMSKCSKSHVMARVSIFQFYYTFAGCSISSSRASRKRKQKWWPFFWMVWRWFPSAIVTGHPITCFTIAEFHSHCRTIRQ